MSKAAAVNVFPLDHMTLDPRDAEFFRDLIFELSGISMGARKDDMVYTRLKARVKKLGLSSYGEYRRYLENAGPNDPETQLFINQLTTNKTEFFREPGHFDEVVMRIERERKSGKSDPLRIWSAACSTGEEPATLGLVLDSYLPDDRTFHLLATDIDTSVLAKAKNGVYPNESLKGIPVDYHPRLMQGREGATGWFKIDDRIHQKIAFRQHNLQDESLPDPMAFDVIFCRNVLIYFTAPTINFLTEKFYRALKPGGWLVIGHSENLPSVTGLFNPVGRAIYEKI